MTEEKAKNIYLFYGEDTYMSSQKVNFWKDQFVKKYGEDANIQVINDKKIDINKLGTDITSVPFLCDKRLIIVKDLLNNLKPEDQKKFAKFLEKTPDFCILVFHETEKFDKTRSLFKKIKAIGKIEEFKPMSLRDLQNWTLKQAQQKKINIDPFTINFLIQHCGTELWRLSSELDKLATYANNEKITKEMIEQLVPASLSASIFKLTDSLATKNTKESLRTLSLLKQTGQDITRVFFMIVRHYRILIQVKDMYERNENKASITKRLRQHPFVIQKSLAQCNMIDLNRLKKIYENLLEIDKGFKTGRIKIIQQDDSQYLLAIEKLIINCCK